MKVIIQHAVTRVYFKDFENWVANETHARIFASSLEAIDFCMAHKIKQVVLILKFDDPRYDIQLRPFPGTHPFGVG